MPTQSVYPDLEQEKDMIVRIYWTMWAAVLIAALAIFLTGNLTMSAVVVFGFISFGMIFMGMMSVLPATIAHPAPPRYGEEQQATARTKRAPSGMGAVRAFMTERFHPNSVEIRRPKYH